MAVHAMCHQEFLCVKQFQCVWTFQCVNDSDMPLVQAGSMLQTACADLDTAAGNCSSCVQAHYVSQLVWLIGG